MKKLVSIAAVSIVFVAVALASSTANAQGGLQGPAPKNPPQYSPDTFFFVMPVAHGGSDGAVKGVELHGPEIVYQGGIAHIANLHYSGLVITVCDRETGETKIGVVDTGEVLEMPIEDDPRTEGHQFVLKVVTFESFTAQLFLTTQ